MSELFKREELATKYCEQYGVEIGSDLHGPIFNAFCVGYTIAEDGDKARIKELERIIERTIWFVNYKSDRDVVMMLKAHLKKYSEKGGE